MSVLDFKNPDWYDEEDINIFRDAAYGFYKTEMAPHSEKFRKNHMVDREYWNKAGAMGLLCPVMPEEYGGVGGDYRLEMIIMEELERAEVDGFGLSLHNAIVAPYILHYGTEEQKQKWLPKMATGEFVGAIAMTEPSTGSDLQAVRTSAKKDGNGWIINGSKTFITNGGTANLIIIVADTGGEGKHSKSLFVVETDDLEGLQELPQERLNIAVQSVAVMEKTLKHTIDYVKERKAFGKRIIDFQNTQFELAECKTIATVAKNFVYNCCEQHLKGELDTVTASMAKYWTTDMECQINDRCLQMFGGYGFMNEYPVARQWKSSRVQRIYGGTNEIMKMVIGRSL